MEESNSKFYFKPSNDGINDFINDFNKVVNQIGSINNYMEINYKTMENLLRQPESIYVLSYLSQSSDFNSLINTNDKDNSGVENVDTFIDFFIKIGKKDEELAEETKNNIAKWKKFLETVPDDFKNLARDLNLVYRKQKNANEVNCFGNDNVKKLLDQITHEEKQQNLETSTVSSNNLDNVDKQEFEMSGDLVQDFNGMVQHVKNYNFFIDQKLKSNGEYKICDYDLINVVSYLSQINNFDKITDETKVSNFFEDFCDLDSLDQEPADETKDNINKWKEFLKTVKEAQPDFLKGCKELNKITHETANIQEKKNYASPFKTFFKWMFSGMHDTFSNYFNQENNKAKEEYINKKADNFKTKKGNLVSPLSKILKEAKQKALKVENKESNEQAK